MSIFKTDLFGKWLIGGSKEADTFILNQNIIELQNENNKLRRFIEQNYVGENIVLKKKIDEYEDYIKELDNFKKSIKAKTISSLNKDINIPEEVITEVVIFPEKVFMVQRVTIDSRIK